MLLPWPCVFLGHVSPEACLLLEKPWEEVLRTARLTLQQAGGAAGAGGGRKHQYGT